MNVRARYVSAVFVCVGLALLASSVFAQAELPRVGFEENFDTAEGWFLDGGAPIRAMDAQDGTVTFVTHRGALSATMKRPDWPEWPLAPHESNTLMHKRYEKTVDLGVYRYLVVKLDERGTAVKLFVCGRPTPVCYTTGLRVLDLRNVGLDGKQRMDLGIEFLNSSGVGTFDFVRLVRELTDEEKKALMPPPLEYASEELIVHPYHRLEALNARAGRDRRPDAEGQLVCYEDTASRGRVWKLTDQPGDQAFRSGDSTAGWSGDGRYFNVTGGKDGKNVWEPAAGLWRETMGGGKLSDKPMPQYAARWESTLHPTVVYGYRTQWHKPEVDFIFYRYDLATGVETEFARFTTEGKWDVRELAQAEKGDKVVLGLRGTFRVWIIDPEAKPPAEIVTPITLPTRLKGIHFAKDDTTLIWFNCYTYEQLQMDLATPQAGQARKVTLGYYTSGGHAGGGGGRTLRHYAGMTTVQPAGLTDWKAG
ncbi:MAG TPA: hypothetical protein VMY39_11030, partial [Planctomycetota bacterium]|nr:hypothetical protein [Planctomycetota bacterium]